MICTRNAQNLKMATLAVLHQIACTSLGTMQLWSCYAQLCCAACHIIIHLNCSYVRMLPSCPKVATSLLCKPTVSTGYAFTHARASILRAGLVCMFLTVHIANIDLAGRAKSSTQPGKLILSQDQDRRAHLESSSTECQNRLSVTTVVARTLALHCKAPGSSRLHIHNCLQL